MESIQSTWFGAFLRLLGFDANQVPSGTTSVEFMWMNMPTSWGVFVLVGAIVAIGVFVFFLYGREIETCPRPLKIALGVTRFCVLLLLVLVLLGPALRYNQIRTIEPYIMLVRDGSQSMSTADEYLDDEAARMVAEALDKSVEAVRAQKLSRADLLNQLLEKDDHEFVHKLQELGMVRILDFAHEVRQVGTLPAKSRTTSGATPVKNAPASDVTPATIITKLEPFGRGTNIGQAVNEAVGVNPLAAVILFTDGQRTLGDELSKVAERLKKRGVKLLVVGVGDPRRTRNIRVKEVYVREKVWPNEPFEVDAVVDIEGDEIKQKEIRVELIQHQVTAADATPDAGSVIQNKNVPIPATGGLVRAKFEHRVSAAGKYKYTVKVQAIDNERKVDDNEEQSGVIEAVERKAKVLLISGAPSWEYRMVHRLLQRDNTISVSCWLQTMDEERPQEGNEPIVQLPTTMEELAKYHVIMMFDPNPDEFDEAWVRLLKDFAAKQSGGILYMAGPKYSGMFLGGSRTAGLKDLLPVRFGDVGLMEAQSWIVTNTRESDLAVVRENIDHPVMSFFQDPNQNLAQWESLPGIFWSFPAIGAKPTAKVLLEHSDPVLRGMEGYARPLLVAGRYGPANTVYIGFNGTWRWRRVGRQAEFFDKYWLQVVRYLIETRTLQNQRRGYVEPERNEYEVGDKVLLIAQLKDAAHEPLMVDEVGGRLKNPDGVAIPVAFKKVGAQPGQYEATVTAREEGNFAVEINLPGTEGTEPMQVETSFQVRLPSLETEQVWLDEAALREVAATSGGEYFTVNELDRLASSVPFREETLEIKGKPELLWSLHQIPYRLMFLLVVLLSAEWALRKGFKLL